MKAVYNILAILSVSTVLAGGGVLGVLYGQGRLSAGRMEQIAEILRDPQTGEMSDGLGATDEPWTAEAGNGDSLLRSAEELREQRRSDQLRRASLERAQQDLAAQRRLVDQALQELIVREEAFTRMQQEWLDRQKRLTDTLKDEGFEREVAYVSRLAPRQAKEHVIRIWRKSPADAVRLFNALRVSTGQQILAQFKTNEELNVLHELLEQIRMQDVDSGRPGSGTTADG